MEFKISVMSVKSKLMHHLLHLRRKSGEVESRLVKIRVLIITGNIKILVFRANKAPKGLGIAKNLKLPQSLLHRLLNQMGWLANEVKVGNKDQKSKRKTAGSAEFPLKK